jgi:hypothetical protein
MPDSEAEFYANPDARHIGLRCLFTRTSDCLPVYYAINRYAVARGRDRASAVVGAPKTSPKYNGAIKSTDLIGIASGCFADDPLAEPTMSASAEKKLEWVTLPERWKTAW